MNVNTLFDLSTVPTLNDQFMGDLGDQTQLG